MKPSVLIFIDTRIIGGPARGLFHFLDCADHSRFDYTLCAIRYLRGSYEFSEEVARRGYRMIELVQRRRFDWRPLLQLAHLMQSERFSIIQTHGYKGHAIAFLTKILGALRFRSRPFFKRRWIAFSHGWTTEDFKVRLYHSLDLLTLGRADVCVVVSRGLRDDLKRSPWIRGEPVIVSNAINIEGLAPLAGGVELKRALNIPPESTVIGCIGRLSSEKGQHELLTALKLLALDNVCLILVGDGPDRSRLESEAAEMGLGKLVRFVGQQKNLAPYYDAIDCLVIPSLSEGLPNVLLEAMAYRKPVISTPVGEIPTVVQHRRTGFLTASATPVAIAACLREYLDCSRDLAPLVESAYTQLEKEFSAAARARKVVEIYEKSLPIFETPPG